MSDTAVWCVAVLLVSAGVAAEGYLAWMFIRDWREGHTEERDRRARWRAASKPEDRSSRSIRVAGGTTLAVLGMTAAVAAAQPPASPPATEAQSTPPSARWVEGSPEPTTTATMPAAGTSASEAPAPAPAPAETAGSAISLQLNLDFTNAYFYPGIHQ